MADAAAVRNAVELIHRHPGPLVIVVSALGGVTDLLARRRAPLRRTAMPRRAARSPQRSCGGTATWPTLLPAGPHPAASARFHGQAAREYREIAHAVAALAELSPRASRHARGAGRARGQRARRRRPPRRGPAGRARRRGRDRGHRRPPRRRDPRPRGHAAQRAPPPRVSAAPRGHAGGARASSARAPDGSLDDPRPGRLGPHRHPPRPRPRRRAGGALEGRARHPDRRPQERARRAPRAAAPPPRGGRGRLLRGQGPAPAGPHSPRRQPDRAARALVRRAHAARHRGLDPPHPGAAIP